MRQQVSAMGVQIEKLKLKIAQFENALKNLREVCCVLVLFQLTKTFGWLHDQLIAQQWTTLTIQCMTIFNGRGQGYKTDFYRNGIDHGRREDLGSGGHLKGGGAIIVEL